MFEFPDYGEVKITPIESNLQEGHDSLANVVNEHSEDIDNVDKINNAIDRFENTPSQNQEAIPTPDRARVEELISMANDLVNKNIINEATLDAARVLTALKRTEYKLVIKDQEVLIQDLPNLDLGVSEEDQMEQKARVTAERYKKKLQDLDKADYYVSVKLAEVNKN